MIRRIMQTQMLLGVLCLAACTYEPLHFGFPGPYATRQYFDRFAFYGHPVEFTVYYPDHEPPDGGFPAVVFNAGWNQPRTTNEAWCVQLAQWGFVVVNRQYPSLLDPYFVEHVEHNTRVLDWALAENERPGSRLFGRINPEKLGVAGYSMGAGIAVAAAIQEKRFKACVALDNLSGAEGGDENMPGLDTLEAATMYIRSTYPNRFGTPADLFDRTPPPAMQVDVLGASHMEFEDRVVALNQLGPLLAFPNGPADDYEIRTIVTRYSVAWLRVYLEGDPAFLPYLVGEAAQADVAAGLITMRSKMAADAE